MSTYFQYQFRPLDWASSPQDFTGDNNLGVHTAETTQRYVYGTRYITWDGKVYKYSKSGASCYTGRLNAFWNTINSDTNGIDYSVFTNNQSAGDREVTLTNGSTTAIGEDDLAGGFIVIKPSETYTDGELMFRGIVGNESAATAAECRMFLDAPLESAITTSNYGFVMPSAYNNIRYSTAVNGLRSLAGLAATYITGSGYNFWLQTYGVCWLSAQSVVGATSYRRSVWARDDGSVDLFDECDNALTYYVHGGSTDQCVGFILDNNSGANGATNFMLTIST